MRISSVNNNYTQSSSRFSVNNSTVSVAKEPYNVSFTSWHPPKIKYDGVTKKLKPLLGTCERYILAAALALSTIFLHGKFEENGNDSDFLQIFPKKFATKTEAVNYAIDKIKVPLNTEHPREYGVIIDYNTYEIVSEKMGTDSTVNAYPLRYIIKDILNEKHPFIMLHGHPEDQYKGRYATRSFSPQDFKSFAKNDNEIESYVVDKNGRYCLFRKKEGFIKPTEDDFLDIEKKLNAAVNYCWANPIKSYKDGKVIRVFYDFQGIHVFWKEVADKYNFEYYTTFGVYDGVDAYIDYYYPDLDPPLNPTSHREHKL